MRGDLRRYTLRPVPLPSAPRRLRQALRFAKFALHVGVGTGIATNQTLRRWAARRPDYPYPPIEQWWHGRLCRALNVKVEIKGVEPLRSALYVANHISWLDIPVIGGAAPTAFVSKADVDDWFLVGWLTRIGGTIFIPRGEGQASAVAAAIARRLEEGGSILVFPEGTTTDGSWMRPFFPRLFAAVQQSGATIQPVALRYPHPAGVHPTAPFIDDETLPSHLARVLAEQEIRAEVEFLPAIVPAGQDRRQLAAQCRAALCNALGLPEEVGERAARRAFGAKKQGPAAGMG